MPFSATATFPSLTSIRTSAYFPNRFDFGYDRHQVEHSVADLRENVDGDLLGHGEPPVRGSKAKRIVRASVGRAT